MAASSVSSSQCVYNIVPNYFKRFTASSLGHDVTDNNTADLYNKERSISFIMNDKFCREDERLKTFKNWPHLWLDKRQLAQTGMFYTGQDDKVKCYFCEVEIGLWEREDEPVHEHLHWSPHCPLLRRRTTNNVPINAEELNNLLPPTSYDVCGIHDSFESRRTNVIAEYPDYVVEGARIRSFADWPKHMKQTPSQMAEAGFFYSGNGDRVKCFSCGGGLKDWNETDEPWEQHAIWLPKCRFLNLMKGQSYIDAVIAAKQKTNEAMQKQSCSTQTQTPSTSSSSSSSTATSTETTALLSSITTDETPSDINVHENANEAGSSLLSEPLMRDVNLMVTSTSTSATSSPSPSSSSSDRIVKCCASTKPPTQPTQITTSNNIPEEKLCKICYTHEYNTAFLPCGHVVACAKCASSVTKCPMCRKQFTDIMRVYFS